MSSNIDFDQENTDLWEDESNQDSLQQCLKIKSSPMSDKMINSSLRNKGKVKSSDALIEELKLTSIRNKWVSAKINVGFKDVEYLTPDVESIQVRRKNTKSKSKVARNSMSEDIKFMLGEIVKKKRQESSVSVNLVLLPSTKSEIFHEVGGDQNSTNLIRNSLRKEESNDLRDPQNDNSSADKLMNNYILTIADISSAHI